MAKHKYNYITIVQSVKKALVPIWGSAAEFINSNLKCIVVRPADEDRWMLSNYFLLCRKIKPFVEHVLKRCFPTFINIALINLFIVHLRLFFCLFFLLSVTEIHPPFHISSICLDIFSCVMFWSKWIFLSNVQGCDGHCCDPRWSGYFLHIARYATHLYIREYSLLWRCQGAKDKHWLCEVNYNWDSTAVKCYLSYCNRLWLQTPQNNSNPVFVMLTSYQQVAKSITQQCVRACSL